jgi:hypothetical protein
LIQEITNVSINHINLYAKHRPEPKVVVSTHTLNAVRINKAPSRSTQKAGQKLIPLFYDQFYRSYVLLPKVFIKRKFFRCFLFPKLEGLSVNYSDSLLSREESEKLSFPLLQCGKAAPSGHKPKVLRFFTGQKISRQTQRS